jgi:hypothetical protein
VYKHNTEFHALLLGAAKKIAVQLTQAVAKIRECGIHGGNAILNSPIFLLYSRFSKLPGLHTGNILLHIPDMES